MEIPVEVELEIVNGDLQDRIGQGEGWFVSARACLPVYLSGMQMAHH